MTVNYLIGGSTSLQNELLKLLGEKEETKQSDKEETQPSDKEETKQSDKEETVKLNDVIKNNILFDEKIGGSIHMAVGASYPEAGGKNKSGLHWDMIKNMKNGGKIYADDQLIYENGKFII